MKTSVPTQLAITDGGGPLPTGDVALSVRPAALRYTSGMTKNNIDLNPVTRSERIDAMDILRGIAIIGILLMNIEWFHRSFSGIGHFDESLTGLDHAVGWLIRCFVEGKFYKLFALLFGMGFAVMLIRAKEAGRPFFAWFRRRMLVLFLIGMLHMIFIWGGDILHDYAFAGLLLMGWIYLLRTKYFSRFDNPRSTLRIALIWLSAPFVLSALAATGFALGFDHAKLEKQWQDDQAIAQMVAARMASRSEPAEPQDSTEPGAELTEEQSIEKRVREIAERKGKRNAEEKIELAALTQDSFWRATEFRLRYAGFMLLLTPVLAVFVLLPVFLLGFWFVSSGIVRNHREYDHLFRPMAWIGMSFGLALTIAALLVIQHPAAKQSFVLRGTGETLFFLGQYAMAAGYLGLIITLLGSLRWSKVLGSFAPMGRMALTNYIVHSVILTTISYGYAGGLFGEISRASQMLLVVAIIIFQFFYSRWWLGRYQFGPLEWAWRCLTYEKLQPMKAPRHQRGHS